MSSAWLLCVVSLCCGAGAAQGNDAGRAAIALEGARDSMAVSDLEQALWLHEAQVEAWFDPATWAAMDALLLHPVSLPRGALLRLAVLPWLGASHVESLRRATTLHSWQDLARLPGWDEELARRVLPFVRFEPAPSSWNVRGQSRWNASRRESRWQAGGSGWSGALRLADAARTGPSGFVAVQRGELRGLAGDMRLGFAQGLLWWSSEDDLRASSAALRQARGLAGTDARDAPRTLRGAGVDWRWGRLQLQAVRGMVEGGVLSGMVTAVALPARMVLRLGGLSWQYGRRSSVAWGWRDVSGRVEMELVPSRSGAAAALAVERRLGAWRLASRLQLMSPHGGVSMAAAGPTERSRSSRHALLRIARRYGAVHAEVALHRRMRRDSLGMQEGRVEQRYRAHWRWKRTSIEVRFRQRDDTRQALGVEGPESAVHTGQRGIVLRCLHGIDGHGSIGLDYRLEEAWAPQGGAKGSAWQLHFQQRRRNVRARVALTSFTAPSGIAAPSIADPGTGIVPVSRLLVGDGIRAAGALRIGTERFEMAVRCGRSFVASGSQRTDWEWSLRVQLD